jgi:hypothetical protein
MPTLYTGKPPSGKHRSFSRKQTAINASLKTRNTLKAYKATLNAKATLNTKAEKASINAAIQEEHAASRAAKAAINAAIKKEQTASNSKTGGNKTRRARKSRSL